MPVVIHVGCTKETQCVPHNIKEVQIIIIYKQRLLGIVKKNDSNILAIMKKFVVVSEKRKLLPLAFMEGTAK